MKKYMSADIPVAVAIIGVNNNRRVRNKPEVKKKANWAVFSIWTGKASGLLLKRQLCGEDRNGSTQG